jgi:hypothetical protein
MMMTYEAALQIAQDMYIESGATDLELGAAQVLRDLHTIANNTSCPLVQVEAIEILFALAQGPDNDTSWIPQRVKELAQAAVKELKEKGTQL